MALVIGLERNEKEAAMANDSEFLIPSAILASAVLAKSELIGEDLVKYGIDLQRRYIAAMRYYREHMAAGPSRALTDEKG